MINITLAEMSKLVVSKRFQVGCCHLANKLVSVDIITS